MTSATASRRIAIIAFFGGLGGGLVFPILPALGLKLGIPAFMIGLILSANRISRVIFNVPAGHVIGRLGPRLTLGGALCIETVGVLGYSAALHFGNAMWWLLAGRALFGIGTAFLLVGAQAAVLSLSDKGDRGRKTSTVRVAVSAAVPAGLVIGGVLADVFSDDVAFLTGAAITFAGALFALIFLPRASVHANASPPTPRGQDRLAALLRSPARPFVVAAWGLNLLVFLTMQGVLLATMVLLVKDREIHLFDMQARGTSGLIMAVLIGCSAVMAVGIGRAIDKAALRTTLPVPSLGVLAAGFGTLAVAHSTPVLIVGAVLVGLSYNGVTLPMMALLGDVTSEGQHGPAVGIYQLFGDIGGTVGPIAGIEVGTNIGLEPLYLAIAALIVLALPFALWLRRYEQARLVRRGAEPQARGG
ncbi:MAG: MFS transporter [Gammaproteobacteria bacterium]